MHSFKYFLAKGLRKILNRPAIVNSEVDSTARCDIGCNVSNSKMGKYSYIGEYTSLSTVEVGSYTSISSGCTIGGGAHPIDWVSTSPVFTSHRSILRANLAYHSFNPYKVIKIGNDVWIGSNCMIKSGVTISDGAIIGMGSVVTKDVGPYEIWAGNPAKLIRKRFDDETINKLLDIQWWNWNEDKISEKAEYMNNVELFLNEVNK